ncbi:MAG TPA: NUDIX domain-containing protein [Bacteroidales bacterium]|nr:NUDIX domain-containing protein [Bacteroidales bacterium]
MIFSQKFKYCPVCGSEKFVQHNIKSMCCEECGFIYYINPSAATAAFIRNEAGDLLVCRRSHEPAKGTLDLPGGFIDYNETAEEGIAREVMEEVGIKVENFRYVFSLPNDYLYSDLDIPTMDLFFEGKVKNGTQIQAADDVCECFFIPVRELNPELFGLKSIRHAIKLFISAFENERRENFLA